jgi:hypothetical protein
MKMFAQMMLAFSSVITEPPFREVFLDVGTYPADVMDRLCQLWQVHKEGCKSLQDEVKQGLPAGWMRPDGSMDVWASYTVFFSHTFDIAVLIDARPSTLKADAMNASLLNSLLAFCARSGLAYNSSGASQASLVRSGRSGLNALECNKLEAEINRVGRVASKTLSPKVVFHHRRRRLPQLMVVRLPGNMEQAHVLSLRDVDDINITANSFCAAVFTTACPMCDCAIAFDHLHALRVGAAVSKMDAKASVT